MLYTRASWERYAGQTRWKGEGPGTGLVHNSCGGEILTFTQSRTIWETGPGSCASDGQENVSILQCVKCHGEPKEVKPGAPIERSELIEIGG